MRLGFFDFIGEVPSYAGCGDPVLRLNKRYELILQPFRGELDGARVLDLGAHDGRWCYALAEAGAARVVGIEARPELVARYDDFPDAPWKGRVELRVGEVFEALESFAADGTQFDVVALFGLFYHVMDHFRLLRLIRLTGARIVLIDSEFMLMKNPMIQLMFERTGSDLNATPQIEGQDHALVGVPSRRAMNAMARALDFDVVWSSAADVFGDDRKGVQDYFRDGNKRRAACCLIARDL